MPPENISYSRQPSHFVKKTEPIVVENTPIAPELVNDDQILELVELAQKLGANLNKTCDHFNIESLDEMTVAQWDKVMRKLESKLLGKDKERIIEADIKTESEITEEAKNFWRSSMSVQNLMQVQLPNIMTTTPEGK